MNQVFLTLLLLSPHAKYAGLAIELKTPKGDGILKQNQVSQLQYLKSNG